jgi:hypothetical protein
VRKEGGRSRLLTTLALLVVGPGGTGSVARTAESTASVMVLVGEATDGGRGLGDTVSPSDVEQLRAPSDPGAVNEEPARCS